MTTLMKYHDNTLSLHTTLPDTRWWWEELVSHLVAEYSAQVVHTVLHLIMVRPALLHPGKQDKAKDTN